MASVVFDPVGFVAQYPEFTGIASASLTGSFNQATFFCANTDNALVQDIPTRTTLLWLLTAHITKLIYGTNDGAGNVTPPPGMIGRLEVAKTGTVDGKADMGPPSGSAAWYNQTRYGAMYYAMVARFRSFRYVPFNRPGMNNQGATPAIWPWGRFS